MERFVNAGKAEVELAKAGILSAGGEESRIYCGYYDHVIVYLNSRNWKLTYDDYGLGGYRNVRSTV